MPSLVGNKPNQVPTNGDLGKLAFKDQVQTGDLYDASVTTAKLSADTQYSMQGFRNRIINGDMRIDQRNAGASVSIGTGAPYIVDRWNSYTDLLNMTGQRSTTVPSGFTNSLLITVGTGASPTSGQISRLEQRIEGFNVADLGWGSASAQTITLSFWARSSVTGTHSGAINNSASSRNYPFTFTISVANTWEYKTVTIPGDTTGTWLTDNGTGFICRWNLGTGSTYLGTAGSWTASNCFGATGSVQVSATTGATFYITGVQLEAGSVASPFERRDYGRELMMAQRYCYGQNNSAGQSYYWFGISGGSSSTSAFGMVQFPVTMRSSPTATFSAANTFFLDPGITNFTSVVIDQKGVNGGACTFTGGSGMTAGYSGRFLSDNTDAAFIIWSAEL